MVLDDLYTEAVSGRVAALDTRDPSVWPRMSLVLERCTDRVVAILAVLESGKFGDGWEDDIASLQDVATRWTMLSDGLAIVERKYSRLQSQ